MFESKANTRLGLGWAEEELSVVRPAHCPRWPGPSTLWYPNIKTLLSNNRYLHLRCKQNLTAISLRRLPYKLQVVMFRLPPWFLWAAQRWLPADIWVTTTALISRPASFKYYLVNISNDGYCCLILGQSGINLVHGVQDFTLRERLALRSRTVSLRLNIAFPSFEFLAWLWTVRLRVTTGCDHSSRQSLVWCTRLQSPGQTRQTSPERGGAV